MDSNEETSEGTFKLDHETKAAVRSYMLQIFTIGGILIAVIAGVAGFLIKDLATKTAITDALQKMQEPLMKAYKDVNEISMNAANSIKEAKESLDKAKSLSENIEGLKSYVESEEIRTDVAKKIAGNSVFRSQVKNAINGDYADLKDKSKKMLENTQKLEKDLKDLRANLNRPKPYGFYAYRKAWIENFDEYGTAEIEVKKGDIVKVDLIGSARNSKFYYNIVEKTGGAEIIAKPTGPADNIESEHASVQLISKPTTDSKPTNDWDWKSFTTIGLFRAKEKTRLKFKANFQRGGFEEDASIHVFGLTLIATVVGS